MADVVFGAKRVPVDYYTVKGEDLESIWNILQRSSDKDKSWPEENVLSYYRRGNFVPLFMCDDCLAEQGIATHIRGIQSRWGSYKTNQLVVNGILDKDEEWIAKYCVPSRHAIDDALIASGGFTISGSMNRY
jgi:hypothetical protein